MDKQLWQDVETLFHNALEVHPNERTEFVRTHSEDNSQLQIEVITLLKSHDSESNFLERNATSDWSDKIEQLAGDIQRSSGDLSSSDVSSDLNLPAEPTVEDAGRKTEPEERESSTRQFESSVAKMIEAIRSDFVVKRVINRGGMGTVLRVYQRRLDRDVAVKVLSSTVIDESMRRRFIRESKAAAHVKNDHVVGIYEVCNDPELPFLVMELIEGPSLKRFIETKGQIEPKIAAELARQIAVGLSAAHQQHLIHRDIKPANVLLEPLDSSWSGGENRAGFRAKIIDFGLARDVDNPSDETQDLMFAGTIFYMSPEQFSRPDRVDHRCDIYSLGITLYQMLTGEMPFRGAPHMVMRKIELSDPTPPRKLDDRIPKDLESICLKAVSKEPGRRYQTATEFADDLSRFLAGHPTEARPVTSPEKFSRWIARNRRVAFFAGLAASMLLLLTISSLIFAYTVKSKDQRISDQKLAISSKDQAINTHIVKNLDSQINRVLDADAGALLFAIEDLDANRDSIVGNLESAFVSDDNDFNRRFNASVALSKLGSHKSQFIVENIGQLFVSPDVFRNVFSALDNDPEAIGMLRRSIPPVVEVMNRDRKDVAKRIVLLAHLGDFSSWTEATNYKTDLSLNTEIVHAIPSWHGDLSKLAEGITSESNPELQWPFAQAIQLLDRRSLNQDTFEALTRHFHDQLENSQQFSAYATAKQLLDQWNMISESRSIGPDWYSLSNGIRMVEIQPATSRMGRLDPLKKYIGFPPHDVTITRPFFIADTEVTVAQYLEFVRDQDYPENQKPFDIYNWKYSGVTSPSLNHPVQMVSWNDAILFCNWLSSREGLTPAYKRMPQREPTPTEPLENVIYLLKNDQQIECEFWACDLDTNGYRLPHEHEFGLACRAESESIYFYGTQADYFPHYGLASSYTSLPASPVRSRLPNRLGIYDLHGNLWEWCNDWFYHMDSSPKTDPVGPDGPDPNWYGRSTLSGGVGSTSGSTDSDSRGMQPPESRADNTGFRVARYADRD